MGQEHWKLRLGLESNTIETLITEELGREAIQAWQTNLADKFTKIEGYTDTADRAEVTLCVLTTTIVWMDLVRLY